MMWNWPWDDEQLDRDGNPIRQAAGPSVPMMQRGVYDEDGNASVMDVPRASVPVAQGGSPYGAILGEGDMEIRDGAWRTRQSNPNNYQNSEAYQLALSNASPRFESPYWAGGNGGAAGFWQRGDDSLLRQMIQSDAYVRSQQGQYDQNASLQQRSQDFQAAQQQRMFDQQMKLSEAQRDKALELQDKRDEDIRKRQVTSEVNLKRLPVEEAGRIYAAELPPMEAIDRLGAIPPRLGVDGILADIKGYRPIIEAAKGDPAISEYARAKLLERYGGREGFARAVESLAAETGYLPVAGPSGALGFAAMGSGPVAEYRKQIPGDRIPVQYKKGIMTPADMAEKLKYDQVKQANLNALEFLFKTLNPANEMYGIVDYENTTLPNKYKLNIRLPSPHSIPSMVK